jgi:hypothetical protein
MPGYVIIDPNNISWILNLQKNPRYTCNYLFRCNSYFVVKRNTITMWSSKNDIWFISGYLRAVQSGPELLSPPFENIDRSKVCITADVRTSQDKAPHLHLVLREVETKTELLLRHDSLPVISAEWQTLKYQVRRIETVIIFNITH